MFLGFFFSVVAGIAGLYYSLKHTNPELIHIVRDSSAREDVKASDEIVYKIFLPSFQDSDGDGIGDAGGLIERLSYFKDLGIESLSIANLTDERKLSAACKEKSISIRTDDNFEFSRIKKLTERARLDAMLLLTQKKSPVIHYGEEIGLAQESGWFGQPDARVPMQWDSGPIAGFSTTQPWIDFSERVASVKEQWEDYDSLLWLYKKLIELRSFSDALRWGDQVYQPHDHSDLVLYSRSYHEKTMWVALNMGSSFIRLIHVGHPQVHLSTHSNRSDGFELQPFEGIIWSY